MSEGASEPSPYDEAKIDHLAKEALKGAVNRPEAAAHLVGAAAAILIGYCAPRVAIEALEMMIRDAQDGLREAMN